jgi:hypothetical protein
MTRRVSRKPAVKPSVRKVYGIFVRKPGLRLRSALFPKTYRSRPAARRAIEEGTTYSNFTQGFAYEVKEVKR